jgi:hypothetical protein
MVNIGDDRPIVLDKRLSDVRADPFPGAREDGSPFRGHGEQATDEAMPGAQGCIASLTS